MEARDHLHPPAALTPRKKRGTNSIRGWREWEGARTGLEVVEKRKTLYLPGLQTRNVQLVAHQGPINSAPRTLGVGAVEI